MCSVVDTSRNFRGLGLVLAIVRQTVQRPDVSDEPVFLRSLLAYRHRSIEARKRRGAVRFASEFRYLGAAGLKR